MTGSTIPGWAFLLAAIAAYPLAVAMFGDTVERILAAPDPEEDELAVAPCKAGELVTNPQQERTDRT